MNSLIEIKGIFLFILILFIKDISSCGFGNLCDFLNQIFRDTKFSESVAEVLDDGIEMLILKIEFLVRFSQ